MILKDLHLRMIENFQNTGSGYSLYDTRSRIYTLTSTDAINGYASCIVLPQPFFGTTVTFTCEARVISGDGANIEIHHHSSPYYGVVFVVGDSHEVTSSEWTSVKIGYNYSAPDDRKYPRINLENLGNSVVEFRYMELRTVGQSIAETIVFGNEILNKDFGPKFTNTQGLRTTTSGDGVIDEATSDNYTELSSSSGEAYITIDDFAGFERNPNTEFYLVELDASVPQSTKDAVLKFIYRDAVGGDVEVICKLTPTIENGVASTESYQNYQFIVPQDGFPTTIDEVEILLGSFTGNEQSVRVRNVRIKGYGLTTLNLKQKELHSCCMVERTGSGWEMDEDYRRENFTTISEFDATTLQINYDYTTAKSPIPNLTPFTSGDYQPFIYSVSNTSLYIHIGFRDSTGSVVNLASVPTGYKIAVLAQS